MSRLASRSLMSSLLSRTFLPRASPISTFSLTIKIDRQSTKQARGVGKENGCLRRGWHERRWEGHVCMSFRLYFLTRGVTPPTNTRRRDGPYWGSRGVRGRAHDTQVCSNVHRWMTKAEGNEGWPMNEPHFAAREPIVIFNVD